MNGDPALKLVSGTGYFTVDRSTYADNQYAYYTVIQSYSNVIKSYLASNLLPKMQFVYFFFFFCDLMLFMYPYISVMENGVASENLTTIVAYQAYTLNTLYMSVSV